MIDKAFTPLLPYLQQADQPTVWLADESVLPVLAILDNSPRENIHILTNRYDIYLQAVSHKWSVNFSDFLFEDIPFHPSRIIYRLAKEKALNHYLFNESAKLLGPTGKLIISGKKQEGVKTYASNLVKHLGGEGKLKKSSDIYHGSFNKLNSDPPLADQDYKDVRKISPDSDKPVFFYSKPGVFGWNKVDKGSELLLRTLPAVINDLKLLPKNVLDLGCGYGWLFMNLPKLLTSTQPNNTIDNITITATDNNAAALLCAHHNSELLPVTVNIIPDDCAKNIKERFDLIICNPPFHQGFSHAKTLTKLFLAQTAAHLDKEGLAILVVNEFIHFDKEDLNAFRSCDTVCQQDGFKIIVLR